MNTALVVRLTMAAFMHHDDQGNTALRYYAEALTVEEITGGEGRVQ